LSLLFLDSVFDPTQQILLACLNSNNIENNVTKLREELKSLISEVNTKRKDISLMILNEDGLRKNIKHLEDIISIKVTILKLLL